MTEKFFNINANGCSVRSKIYLEDKKSVSKVVLYGHGFGGHKDNNRKTETNRTDRCGSDGRDPGDIDTVYDVIKKIQYLGSQQRKRTLQDTAEHTAVLIVYMPDLSLFHHIRWPSSAADSFNCS